MRYPIIDNREVLEPKKIVMPEGGSLPRHAVVYTQHEWKFIQDCKNGGAEVNVKLRNKFK